jgi:hypothetical protein
VTAQIRGTDRELQETFVGTEEERPQTFIEWVLALLEDRFPWLGSEHHEPASGAETVDELANLHHTLLQKRDKASGEDADSET